MKTNKQVKSKNGLKSYYGFKEIDFYIDGEEIRLNCKDNAGELVNDVWENLELERKEQISPRVNLEFDNNNENVELWKQMRRNYETR